MVSFKSITAFKNCDILIGQHFFTYDRSKTFGDVIDMALELNCPIIVKTSLGNWEIKGKGLTYEKLKEEINKNIDPSKFNDKVVCYFIDF